MCLQILAGDKMNVWRGGLICWICSEGGDGQRVDADPQAMLMRDEHVCDQSHGLGICVLNEWALIL